jgi:hypothetical protein
MTADMPTLCNILPDIRRRSSNDEESSIVGRLGGVVMCWGVIKLDGRNEEGLFMGRSE